jgi:hypothetical protein
MPRRDGVRRARGRGDDCNADGLDPRREAGGKQRGSFRASFIQSSPLLVRPNSTAKATALTTAMTVARH